MDAHHQSAIDAFVSEAHREPAWQAILLCGSLGRGDAAETSDVDLMVVSNAQDVASRRNARLQTVFFVDFESTGANVDVKFIDTDFLSRVADRGSEPARFAFQGSTILWSQDPDIDSIVERVPVFQVEGADQRLARFAAQLEAANWFSNEAAKRADVYLSTWAATRAVLFASRMILTHNQILFPFHKWLLRVVADAPEQPHGFLDLIHACMATPTAEAVGDLYASVMNMRDWPQFDDGWGQAFMNDIELTWMHGEPTVEHL